MAGNRSTRDNARQIQNSTIYTQGEKPILNEKIDFQDFVSLGEINRPRTEVREPAEKAGIAQEVLTGEKFKKGMRLFLAERWEDALRELLLVDTEGFSNDERMELAYYLGLCSTKLERYNEAMLYFEQVITVDDNPLRVYQCRMILAYIYIITGRAKLAEAELNRLMSGGLESVMLYNTLAYSAYAQKRYLAAIEFYEKALELDKDNATALNSLGYVLADTGLDKLKGLRLCRKAVEKNPDNPAYLDSLGWAYYKNGKLKEAGSWLRRAMDIAPHETEIKKHFRIITGEAL